MTNGNTTASVTIPAASRRLIATSGDDNSMTGSSVQADIDQSDTRRTPANGATRAGASNTAQNAAAASRRSGDLGQAISLRAAALGRAATSTISSGTAT